MNELAHDLLQEIKNDPRLGNLWHPGHRMVTYGYGHALQATRTGIDTRQPLSTGHPQDSTRVSRLSLMPRCQYLSTKGRSA
jgi:hypothetical protein